MSDFDQELKLSFLEEAAQTAVDLEQCLLSLEQDPQDIENINKIFRLAHNLKGSSKAVGFDEVGAFTHEYETFILKIKNNQLEPSAPVVNLLLRCCDHVNQMIQGLKENLDAKFDSQTLLDEMINGNFDASSQPPITDQSSEADLTPAAPMEDDFFAKVTDSNLGALVSEPLAAAKSQAADLAPSTDTLSDTLSIEPNLDLLRELEMLSQNIPPASGAQVSPPPTSPEVSEIEPNLDLLRELEMNAQGISKEGLPKDSAPASTAPAAPHLKIVEPAPSSPSPATEFSQAPPAAASSAPSHSPPPSSSPTPSASVAIAKPPEAKPPTKAEKAPPAKTPIDDSIRVSIEKVENLLNYVGEMVILQSVLKQQVYAESSNSLRKTTDQLDKISKEIQSLSMSLRMVPVKPTFQKMQRIVRDTAQALGKDVGITLVGEETEIDKTVLEKINDPLVHLIRNSVDHGIEAVDLRTSRNKPKRGQITLSAFHQSGKLVIEVKDDGGGLDPEKLTKIAIQKGVIKAGTNLSKQEAQQLIFAPGFSTKEKVTDVSGRGVGMDVVKTNIQELSGEIFIESEVGVGTSLKIILPLTLAIIDGMLIKYSTEKFILPLNHVHETLKPSANQIQMTVGLGPVLILRGENLPVFNLGDFFGLKSAIKSEEMIAMVVRSGPTPFALLVDDIVGQNQVVVKQLGSELANYRGVSGSTILGDGKPALILEPQDLFKRKSGSKGLGGLVA